MKKILMMAVALMMAVTVSAQSEKGKMALGGNFNIGYDDILTNFGIGPKFSYNFIDHLRGEASFNYYFEKDNWTEWDFNFNLHYVFDIKQKNGLYPLAGLTIMGLKWKAGGYSIKDTNAGFNIGAGWEYRFTDHCKAGIEAKYQWADGGRLVLSLGAAYIF